MNDAGYNEETMTKRYAVIGDPIAHSLSPVIYNTLFEHYGMDAVYTTLQVRAGELQAMEPVLRSLSGFNCTMPHKRDIIPFLKTISPDAAQARSVNTVCADENGAFHGHTTDGEGFARALQAYGGTFRDANVVLLGAGGAAQAAALRAVKEAKSLTVAARDQKKAEVFLSQLGDTSCILQAETMGVPKEETLNTCTVLINATPQGMIHHPPFEDLGFLEMLPGTAIVCDMVYQPRETALLKAAKDRGLAAMPGLPMLMWQGLIAFELYTGVSPEPEAIKKVEAALLAR